MVQTKSVYDPVENSDGERILISRYWPRGISKERLALSQWQKSLAPSKELLQYWKAGSNSWAEYEKRYKDEMTIYQEEIAALAGKARLGTITLLCFEKEEDPHCHRHLLKKMLDNTLFALKIKC